MSTNSDDLSTALQHHKAGRFDHAEPIYRQVLTADPNQPHAWHLLGILSHQVGRTDAAAEYIERAIQLDGLVPEFHSNLGNALKLQGRLDEAIASYHRALELNPSFADAHSNLGNGLKDQGNFDGAAASYRRALELKPDYPEALNNLGMVMKEQGRLDDAVACFRRAMQLKPEYVAAHSNLVYTLTFCTDTAPLRSRLYEELRSRLDEDAPFSTGCQAIQEELHRWNRQHAEPLGKFIEPHLNDRSPDRRLRVGYVSPDFRDHVVGRNLLPLFREHDHQRFEVFCYSDVPRHDEMTRHFQGYADAWCDTNGMTDEQLAQRVRDDRIDILVDLTLHMTANRLLVFARKPAPVQVTFAGYPGSTGLATMDYRLTDPHLDPPGLFERYYSEESVRLPDSFWCYDVEKGDVENVRQAPRGGSPMTHADTAPLRSRLYEDVRPRLDEDVRLRLDEDESAVNALPAAETGAITFGCLNNFCKVNPHVLKLWGRVLKAVDRSRLTLLAGEGSHRQHTLDLLAAEGVAADRVTFVKNQPRLQYLQTYHSLDIGLDTVPYNGHTTSLDSLWMGIPVVTLVGSTVVGRAGLSQLTNLGLPELIASDAEQYVQIAVGLAHDLPRLSKLRATLRDRMQASPLMDAPRFARNIEAAYREMWQRWCRQYTFVWPEQRK